VNDISPLGSSKQQHQSHITHEAGDLHRLLVDRVQDYAIFALDPNGIILTWNVGAERLKQYRPEEIIGKHFSIFYPKEDVESGKPERELEAAAKVGRVEDNGWRVRKDGTRFWANVLITAIRDDDGRLIGFAKVTRDLTTQQIAETELRASEERFRLMVQSVRDYAIFMLDPTGHIATWNEGAERLKGYKPKEIIGKHFSIFYPQEDLDDGKPPRELRIATETGKYEEEGWRIRKDGSRFWAHVIITAVRDSHGNLAGFAKVTRDLTERRASQERALEDARRIAIEESERVAAERRTRELRELADQLHAQAEEIEARRLEAENANRAKAEFLAAMSHELRTPLNAISGYTQLMQLGISGPLTREQAEQLDRIQRSQAHLLGIINDILNFSRIEAGHVAYDTTTVPMSETMESVLTMIAPQAGKKEVKLILEKCDPKLAALADRPKVEQVLLNLLSNAVKFTNAGGSIELRCDADESRLHVKVKDTGIGIPEKQLDTIFAPFAQVGRSLASPKEGTGLGLSISRDLARGMNGDLTVESKVGRGSTFTLDLPRAKAQ
jgi:PAS domain S-box-containing protein